MAFDLDQLLGQDRAVAQLRAMLASSRVHHGLIFHGPAGVGKFTAAIAMARQLLCHAPTTDLMGGTGPCGGCGSCRLFHAPHDDGTTSPVAHPDLHVVTKELSRYSDDANVRARKLTTIPVDVIREHLIGPAFRSAQLGHGKVFVVDEAELLAREGQNALLKTLEEPPAGTVIFLVTSSEERLLPTIRSRCQRIAFVPLPAESIEPYVRKHAAETDHATTAWLVRFADGSLGRARLALDHGLAEWADAVLPMLDAAARGRPVPDLGEQLGGRINAFAERWVKQHDNASKEAANKLGAALMSSLLTVEARRHLAERAAEIDPADPDAGEALLRPWLNVIEAVDIFHARLGSNVNLNLAAAGLGAAIAGGFAEPVAA